MVLTFLSLSRHVLVQPRMASNSCSLKYLVLLFYPTTAGITGVCHVIPGFMWC